MLSSSLNFDLFFMVKKLGSKFLDLKTKFSSCFNLKHIKNTIEISIKPFPILKILFIHIKNHKSNRVKIKLIDLDLCFLTCLKGKTTFIELFSLK